ncbi:putative hydrolase of the HAD superfamily [Kitasatospora gansuensis]|uniref:Putative hydrolase of the HAD superfamily n=1 Tax=Kitasatospora gansuensis TaxID=258050 RepID=A0A7W7S748_9ACTN|nr:HAD family hydrolase [Kitasatospora gansuensis]MBB4945156.1 putative hydrolase of the HAD superfamily [Kitasatospora gansuensis]
MIKGVMFDFSGTLFRIESTEEWLAAILAEAGLPLADEEFADWARRLTEYGALPGGAEPLRVPAHLEVLWHERDLSADQHRAAYTGLLREAGLATSELERALYDRHMTPAAWQPYPDVEPTLRELRSRGIPVAVVSNIGWDLRPVFRAYGLDELVDAYLLSFEVGVQKPEPEIFRVACDALGLAAADVLMVGDDRTKDGGATALGCPVQFVDHLPVDQRPAGLAPVLELLDGAGGR